MACCKDKSKLNLMGINKDITFLVKKKKRLQKGEHPDKVRVNVKLDPH